MNWDEWRGSLDGRPVMFTKHLAHWRGVRLDLHKMMRADDADCFHTHPAWAVRCVLWGGYVEERAGGVWRAFFPGRVGIVRPALAHRIAGLFHNSSFSVWLRFPKCAEVKLIGEGWKQQVGSAAE